MKKNILKHIFLSGAMPLIASAQLEEVRGAVIGIRALVNSVIPVVISLALIYFLWGVGQFILHDAGNEKARGEGKKKMLWGTIAFFIMLSISGIIAWIGHTSNIQINTPLYNSAGDGTLPSRSPF